MPFLRLGVSCAVRDRAGRILLSRRNDLDVWNLPTGRLDKGELLTSAAIREVYEETGIEVQIKRVVGLYHLYDWARMNILLEAIHIGGNLLQTTGETLENRFFTPHELPANNISQMMVDDVINNVKSPMRVIVTPVDELRRVKSKLRWRWIKNLLSGDLEPRYPRFMVSACYEPCDENAQFVDSDGKRPIWEMLNLQPDDTLTRIDHVVEVEGFVFRFGQNTDGNIHYQYREEGES